MYSRLVINNTSYGSNKIYEATYTHNVNAGQQLNIGTVSSAELVFKTEEVFTVGTTVTYSNKPYQSSSFVQQGIFTISNIEKNKNIYTYTCYDNVSLLDVNVDSWYAGLTYPITLANLFSSLCSHLGLTGDTNFDAYAATVPKKAFEATNLNGKSILQWIAQIAGGYAYADVNGVIKIRHFATSGSVYTLTNAHYSRLTKSYFTVPAPDKIRVETNPDGSFTDYGSGNNLVKISGNPFCYDNSGLVAYCGNILGWMISYTPITVYLYEDYGINAGDRITVDGTTTVVMEKKIQGSGVILSSTGLKERQEVTQLKQQSIDLTGYLKQQDYDTGLVNTSGYYSTAGINVTGTKQISGVDYTLNTAVNANGLLATATYGTETNTCGVQTSSTLPRLYIEKNTGLTASSLSLTADTIEHTGTDGSKFELTGTDGLIFGTNNQAFAVYPTKAEDSWWYVYGTRNTPSEPSGYTAWPGHIWPSAVRFFILALAKGTTGAESTSYDRYDWYCYKMFPALPRGFNLEITQDLTYNSNISAHCKINFANYTFKVWGSVTSGPAPVLFAYY